jgi:F-box protein 9
MVGRTSSHGASLHRPFVETIYKPPQILPDEALDDILDKYSSDYRRVYIERPRVRLDGVYIAVCHYMYLPVKEVHLSCHLLEVADDPG